MKIVSRVMEYKSQYKWCDYPDATQPAMGCWSLLTAIDEKRVLTKEFCSKCEFCKGVINE